MSEKIKFPIERKTKFGMALVGIIFSFFIMSAPVSGEANIEKLSHLGHGPVLAVATEGSYLFAGEGTVFVIKDTSYLNNPMRLSELDLEEDIYSIYAAEGYAYVGTDKSFIIVDISNARNPRVAGIAKPEFQDANYNENYYTAKSIKVSGNYAYIAADGYGFVVYDISDKSNPVEVSRIQANNPLGLDIDGNRAYLSGYGSLKVVDIGDPRNPTEIGTWTRPVKYGCAKNQLFGVKVNGGYAFVTDYGYGVHAVNLTSMEEVGFIGSKDCGEEAYAIELKGDTAYVSWWYRGLAAVDISDPANMVGKVIPSSFGLFNNLAGYNYGLSIAGDRAYMAGHYKGVGVFNISDSSSGILAKMIRPSFGRVFGVIENGDYLYLAEDYYLLTVNIRDPRNPAYRRINTYGGRGGSMAINGKYLYLGAGWGPLTIYDISDPAKPKLVKRWSSGIETVNYAKGYLHVSQDNDYKILDISDSKQIKVLGTYTASKLYGFKAIGQYTYLVDGDQFKILDVSDPSNIRVVGSAAIARPTYWSFVAVVGDYAYTNSGYDSIEVIDIKDKTKPVKVNRVNSKSIGSLGGSLTSYENYLIASGESIRIYNLNTDPVRLTVEKEYPYKGKVELTDKYLYLFRGYNGPGVGIYSHNLK